MHVDDDLKLGDPALDLEHTALESAVVAFRDASGEAARVALRDLRALAGDHFAREDDDLRRVGSHNAQCHLDEHAAVLASLDDVLDRLSAPPMDAAADRDLCARLAQALTDWLPRHVREMDAGIAQLRTRERLGGLIVNFQPRPEA